MFSMKIATVTAAALVVAGIAIGVRHGRAQPTDIATYEPERMKDFKKPVPEQLKKKLSSEQFAVTQQCGTEPPFHNAYWDNHKPGIYVDVVSGQPLFSSLDKFDSGTGWPSFTQPLKGAGCRRKERLDAGHGADRGAFERGGFASRPCLRRRPGRKRVALLHQFRRAEIYSGGRHGPSRVQPVSWPVRARRA